MISFLLAGTLVCSCICVCVCVRAHALDEHAYVVHIYVRVCVDAHICMHGIFIDKHTFLCTSTHVSSVHIVFPLVCLCFPPISLFFINIESLTWEFKCL